MSRVSFPLQLNVPLQVPHDLMVGYVYQYILCERYNIVHGTHVPAATYVYS
jgi:hypothetical protein